MNRKVAAPATSRTEVVGHGFKCARGHLDDPRGPFCTVCGIRMEQLTCVLTEGVRPPLGVLLLLLGGRVFTFDSQHGR